ncbi:cAMP-activated global transcriptional regulator CRP [compost metagenome]|jgi:CRP/FNR family cyclic AMP-dependent transcriptional regulator
MQLSSKPCAGWLRDAKWMQLLSAEVQERVIADAYEETHPARSFVAHKGHPATSWIGVAEGLLKASDNFRSGKSFIYSGVPADSWIGEGSLLKDEPRHYDIVAIKPSRTVHIPRTTFRWLLATSLNFNHFLLIHLNERLGQFMGMVETDRIDDPPVKLSRALLSLFNPVLYPGMGSALSISQEELGELAGLSRQRANAAIRVLEAAGLVRANYGNLQIVDLQSLREYAQSGY